MKRWRVNVRWQWRERGFGYYAGPIRTPDRVAAQFVKVRVGPVWLFAMRRV